MPSTPNYTAPSVNGKGSTEKYSEPTSDGSAEKPPKTTFQDRLKRRKNSGNWFIFFRLYFKILGRRHRLDALFLQDLENLSDSPKVQKQTIDGEEYFLCTKEFLERAVSSWSEKEQEHHFAHLRKEKYIKTIRKGADGRRWVCINHDFIEEKLDEAPNRIPPSGGDRIPPSGGANKLNSSLDEFSNKENDDVREESLPERVLFGSPPSFENELASFVHDELFRQKRLHRKYGSLSTWVGKLRDLVEFIENRDGSTRQIAQNYVREVFKDHLSHLEDRYQPHLYTLPYMCKEFPRLEDAIKRRSLPAKEEPVKLPVSPEAKEIVKSLTKHHAWPNGSAESLPHAVQESLTNHQEFVKKANKLLARQDLGEQFRRRVEKGILPALGTDSVSSVRKWFESVWEKVHGWEDWSGSFKSFVWSLSSKKVKKLAAVGIDDYCGAGFVDSLWEKFLEELS